jgi:hypothetical protein
VLLCGVLKETATDGNPNKNRNKQNRMPPWGDERAARRARSKVYICRYLVSNYAMGDQASSPFGVLDDA